MIYHYCCHYQDRAGSIHYIDGIVNLDYRIVSMDEYRKFKKAIVSSDTSYTGQDLTITSLSIVSEKKHERI